VKFYSNVEVVNFCNMVILLLCCHVFLYNASSKLTKKVFVLYICLIFYVALFTYTTFPRRSSYHSLL